ncbi:carbonic anhydrase [Qipengyuania soli]|nr:carbonic anhydrase family protein [Qipengyuania soli]
MMLSLMWRRDGGPGRTSFEESMMKNFAIAAALTLGLSGAAIAQDKDWSFGDGETHEHWGDIRAEYATCDAGSMQSPIDLTSPDARGDIKLETRFGEASGKLALAKQKVQIDFTPGQGKGMTSGDKTFDLLQVHFHTPSEHAVNGKRYPMVAHFVHATQAGELGVLGVFFTEGSENPAIDALLKAHAKGNGAALSVNIDDMIPTDLDVYRYMGSLTTPPCSEGVNWHVADVSVEASAAQIAKLSGALGPSARSIQPRNGRLLVAPE